MCQIDIHMSKNTEQDQELQQEIDKNESKAQTAYTYIVECIDGTLYTGITKDVHKRMQTHAGRTRQSAKYTKAHPIKEVRMVWESTSYSLAARLEYAIKRLRKEQKCQLINNPDTLLEPLFPKLADVIDQYTPAPHLCGSILENQIKTQEMKELP